MLHRIACRSDYRLQWTEYCRGGLDVHIIVTERPEKVTVRCAVFELLRAFGMTTIFGNPGSTELPMFRDFPSDFRYVLGLQESIVVAMADGFAQARRGAALVNLHSAAGVGHALGNLFTAFKNQTPLVVTAGQQARSMLPFEPFLFAKDAAQFPLPYVKWSCEPARAEDVPAAIARAYYVAMQPPRGPTFVSIPVDDWDRQCARIEPRTVSATIQGDSDLLIELSSTLATARYPALVVGAAVAREDAWDEVIALAERHEAPVWTSPMSGRNSFPENHRLFRGFLPAIRERLVTALEGHDLILVAGAPVFTYHVEGFGPFVPNGANLYQLIDDAALAAWAPVGTAIVTSIKPALLTLLAGPKPLRRSRPKQRKHAPFLSGTPFSDKYLMQQIAALRPLGSIIVEEAPSGRSAMQEYLPMCARDSFYTCSSGGLGHGLPASVGIALARRTEKVIAILGDGSTLYSVQGLWNAAQLTLPICFIIVNNHRYEALVQFARHFGINMPIGTNLPNIKFGPIATGLGLEAHFVNDRSALDSALRIGFSSLKPVVIEVNIE